jgi:peptidylprolyl isomerase/peptidyl-prolyl cis-trans isomerase B (cyclophilin B)
VRLPPLYSHFGEIVSGADVVERIDAVGTRSGKPSEAVVIESVTIEEKD